MNQQNSTLTKTNDDLSYTMNTLNRNFRFQINTYYNVYAHMWGRIKTLVITNDKGISPVNNFNYGILPEELRPIYDISKWVNIRDNITAYLEIKISGEVILSHVSETVGGGTWICVHETYF